MGFFGFLKNYILLIMLLQLSRFFPFAPSLHPASPTPSGNPFHVFLCGYGLHYQLIVIRNRSFTTLNSNLFEINFIPSCGCSFTITNDAIIIIILNILCVLPVISLYSYKKLLCSNLWTGKPCNVSPTYPRERIYFSLPLALHQKVSFL